MKRASGSNKTDVPPPKKCCSSDKNDEQCKKGCENAVKTTERTKIDYDKYFKTVRDKNDGQATCLLCEKNKVQTKISRKGMNTTGLRKHLLAKHRSAVQEKDLQIQIVDAKQPTLLEMMNKVS